MHKVPVVSPGGCAQVSGSCAGREYTYCRWLRRHRGFTVRIVTRGFFARHTIESVIDAFRPLQAMWREGGEPAVVFFHCVSGKSRSPAPRYNVGRLGLVLYNKNKKNNE